VSKVQPCGESTAFHDGRSSSDKPQVKKKYGVPAPRFSPKEDRVSISVAKTDGL
jgi:hypothetical protein